MNEVDAMIIESLLALVETVRMRLDVVSRRLDAVQQMAENTDAMVEAVAVRTIENRNRLDRIEGAEDGR